MLILIATPIGNLGDLSPRATEAISNCDYLLCEDTRRTGAMLHHLGIKKKMISFHSWNERSAEDGVIADLKAGKQIALVSDAGTPCISDPGELLVARCRSDGIPVTGIPGPSAAILALSISGLPTERFQFCGFLPKSGKERSLALWQLLSYPGSSILYESPARMISTLEELAKLVPERRVALLRELTKSFEEWLGGNPSELVRQLNQRDEVKGECVLVIAPPDEENEWARYEGAELVAYLETTFRLGHMEAIKAAAQLQQRSKSSLYKKLVE